MLEYFPRKTSERVVEKSYDEFLPIGASTEKSIKMEEVSQIEISNDPLEDAHIESDSGLECSMAEVSAFLGLDFEVENPITDNSSIMHKRIRFSLTLAKLYGQHFPELERRAEKVEVLFVEKSQSFSGAYSGLLKEILGVICLMPLEEREIFKSAYSSLFKSMDLYEFKNYSECLEAVEKPYAEPIPPRILHTKIEESKTDLEALTDEDFKIFKNKKFGDPRDDGMGFVNRTGNKLFEILQSDKRIKVKGRALDVCGAPGGMTQVLVTVGDGLVVDSFSGTDYRSGNLEYWIRPGKFKNNKLKILNFGDDNNILNEAVRKRVKTNSYNLVTADGGTEAEPLDEVNQNSPIWEVEIDIALGVLKRKGSLILKMLQPENSITKLKVARLQKEFEISYCTKPIHSNPISSEFYFVGIGKGLKPENNTISRDLADILNKQFSAFEFLNGSNKTFKNGSLREKMAELGCVRESFEIYKCYEVLSKVQDGSDCHAQMDYLTPPVEIFKKAIDMALPVEETPTIASHPPIDAYKTMSEHAATMAIDPEIASSNLVTSQILNDNNAKMQVDKDEIINPTNARGNPISVKKFRSFGAGIGNHFTDGKPAQAFNTLATRYLGKTKTIPESEDGRSFARQLVDRYFEKNVDTEVLQNAILDEDWIDSIVCSFLADSERKHYKERFEGIGGSESEEGRKVISFNLFDFDGPYAMVYKGDDFALLAMNLRLNKAFLQKLGTYCNLVLKIMIGNKADFCGLAVVEGDISRKLHRVQLLQEVPPKSRYNKEEYLAQEAREKLKKEREQAAKDRNSGSGSESASPLGKRVPVEVESKPVGKKSDSSESTSSTGSSEEFSTAQNSQGSDIAKLDSGVPGCSGTGQGSSGSSGGGKGDPPPKPAVVVQQPTMAAAYTTWHDGLAGFEFGAWYNPSELMKLRVYLSTVNFGDVSSRTEAIARVAAFLNSASYDIVGPEKRFPATRMLSDQDGWFRTVQRINASLSFKMGDKDIKKAKPNNEQDGSRSNDEIDLGNFSDSHKAFISDVGALNLSEIWSRQKFETQKVQRPTLSRILTTDINVNTAQEVNGYHYLLGNPEFNVTQLTAMIKNLNSFMQEQYPNSPLLGSFLADTSGTAIVTHSIETYLFPTWHNLTQLRADDEKPPSITQIDDTDYAHRTKFYADFPSYTESLPIPTNVKPATLALISKNAYDPAKDPIKPKRFDTIRDIRPSVLWFQPYEKSIQSIELAIPLGFKILNDELDSVVIPLPNVQDTLTHNNSMYKQGSIPTEKIKYFLPSDKQGTPFTAMQRKRHYATDSLIGYSTFDMSRNVLPYLCTSPVNSESASALSNLTEQGHQDFALGCTYFAWKSDSSPALPSQSIPLWSSYRFTEFNDTFTIHFYSTLRPLYGTSVSIARTAHPSHLIPS
ncbi:hypothetical protein GE061_016612 [Apolygus lucorum]|uniref:Ribosomal RNA methyltransferase FtsJ domain-containing protein n=1 Tax=Apolygus lucorum TaxID=248454 RepID=A0A8S9XIR5_APOLU|nr:hypothetical protein GE061_016612 [Apolygus lucorum]